MMPNSDPKGQFFLSAPNNYARFFFLHTFGSPAFDVNLGIAIKDSHSYTLTSVILKVDAAKLPMSLRQNYMTSYTTSVLTTHGDIRFLSIP